MKVLCLHSYSISISIEKGRRGGGGGGGGGVARVIITSMQTGCFQLPLCILFPQTFSVLLGELSQAPAPF